jgi:KDO2-lipid IV(A) lauroyltransferase
MNETYSQPTVAQRIKYAMLRILGFFLSLLPHWLARALTRVLGVIAFDILRMSREMVLSYLEGVFPEKTPAERRRIARAGHCNLTMVGMEMLRARFASQQRVISRVTLEDGCEDLYHDLIREGRGIVFISAHYGNWELLGARLASIGYPFTAIFQEHPNPLFNKYLIKVRSKLGINLVNRSEAARQVLKVLRKGGAVGIIADQDASKYGGLVSKFFGKPVISFKGPFAFAVRCDAPLVASWIYRENGQYRAGFDRLDASALSGLADDAEEEVRIQRLADAYTQWLENLIRKDPRQYIWLHPRWQTEH